MVTEQRYLQLEDGGRMMHPVVIRGDSCAIVTLFDKHSGSLSSFFVMNRNFASYILLHNGG